MAFLGAKNQPQRTSSTPDSDGAAAPADFLDLQPMTHTHINIRQDAFRFDIALDMYPHTLRREGLFCRHLRDFGAHTAG